MALASPAMAANAPTYGEKLEGFDYGWPVKHFTFTSQNQPLDMAYTGREAGKTQRPHRGADARQKLLRRYTGTARSARFQPAGIA